MKHYLKLNSEFFEVVATGEKSFEVRRDDRGFKPGDTLHLMEWLSEQGQNTDRFIWAEITYVLRGDDAVKYGVQPGYCVLSIAVSGVQR